MSKKKSKKKQQISKSKTQKSNINDFISKRILYTKNELITILVFALTIVVAGTALYYPVTDYDLVYCDDNIFMHDLWHINKTTDSYTDVFNKTMGTSYYRPILNISLVWDTQQTLEMQYPGVDVNTIDARSLTPEIFHRSNLIFHVLASMLIFIFFLKMRYSIIMSFLFSLMVVVHPILTPAASWISGRNDSMITIFIILSFISMVFYFEKKDIWQFVSYIFHIFFFGVALFTKEITAFLPFVIFAYLLLFEKRQKLFDAKYIVLLAGQFVMGLVWFSMRLKAIEGINNPDTIGIDALWDNIPSIPAMVGKFFVPYKMIALSSYEAFSIITGIVFIILIAFLIYYSKDLNKNKAFFGLFWFVLLIFPTLLIRIVYVEDFFDYAEHRAYLVIVGLIIFIFEILKSYKVDFKKPIPIAVMAVIILLFTVKSYSYKEEFKDRKTFWSHMTDMYPYKSRGYLDLGKAYLVEDSLGVAEELYKKGIERNPDNRNLYIDLAALYLKQGKYDKAIEYADTALIKEPGNHIAHYNRGRAYFAKNNFQQAVKDYEMAVKVPKFPAWFKELADAYYRIGNFDKAIHNYRIAIRANQRNSHAYTNMGLALAQLGKSQDAINSWRNAMSIAPDMPQPYYNLIRMSVNLKQYEQAKQYYAVLMQKGIPIPQDIQAAMKNIGI